MSTLTSLLALLPGGNYLDWDFDDDVHARIVALVESLVATADQALIPELEQHLETALVREDDYSRDVLGEVLAGIAGVDALPALLRASARDLGDDQDTLRSHVSDILDQQPGAARRRVLALTEASDPAVRAAAWWHLEGVAADEDLPAVSAALRTDSHVDVRCAATRPASALASRWAPALETLAAAMEDRDAEVRAYAVVALGDTGVPGAIPYVARLAEDGGGDGGDADERVRGCVANALNRLRRETAPWR